MIADTNHTVSKIFGVLLPEKGAALRGTFIIDPTGVFGCGDILCNDARQAVVAAGQGCIAALSADKCLRGKKSFAKDYK